MKYFEIKYHDIVHDAWAWLKWDESKSIYCQGKLNMTEEEVTAMGIGQLWQRYEQEIIDHIKLEEKGM